MRILIVGNYAYDQQASMERFYEVLLRELPQYGCSVDGIRPAPILSQYLGRYFGAGLGKWLGYVDKFILFPLVLLTRALSYDLVHIVDHSNSPYLFFLSKEKSIISCHDLLAARAALGEETYCPVSRTGRVLQRIILQGLRQARLIICDSPEAYKDVQRLVVEERRPRAEMVWHGLNFPYKVLSEPEIFERLGKVDSRLLESPFILHVGSSQPRKNRELVLKTFAKLSGKFMGNLVFAGTELASSQRKLAKELGIDERLIEIVNPNNLELEAIYNQAFVLLFPSLSEGFGWPIIEAQSCRLPVVLSDIEPCMSIAADSGIVCSLEDEDTFVQAVERLLESPYRKDIIEKGNENVRRFDTSIELEAIVSLYKELLVN